MNWSVLKQLQNIQQYIKYHHILNTNTKPQPTYMIGLQLTAMAFLTILLTPQATDKLALPSVIIFPSRSHLLKVTSIYFNTGIKSFHICLASDKFPYFYFYMLEKQGIPLWRQFLTITETQCTSSHISTTLVPWYKLTNVTHAFNASK